MSQRGSVFSRIVRFVLVACALHALSAHAQSNAEAQNNIQALNVSSAPNGKLVLAVTLMKPMTVPPRNFTASNPPRIAFDFPDTKTSLAQTTQTINQGD